MKVFTVLGCLSVGLLAAAACGGESSRSGDDDANGEAGAPSSTAEGGAAGSAAEPAAAAGEPASGGGAGGAAATGGVSATGGKASGGATGGVATGGAPDLDPIPVPEGCEADSATQGSGSCSLGLTCNQVYQSVFCNEGAGDAWKCYCKGTLERTYELHAETSGAACAVAATFCTGKGPELGELPEECEPTETADSQTCSRQLRCEYTIELDGGTAVLVDRSAQVSCENAGVAESVTCSCGTDEEVVSSAALLGIGVEEACGPALSLCRSKQRKPAGQRECKPESLGAQTGQCSLTQGCAQPLELDDGTVVSVYSADFVDCVTLDEQSRCTCSGDSGSFTFDLETATASETCTQAADVCTRRDDIEAGEDVTCTTQSQSVAGNVCDTELSCSQPGTLDGLAIARQSVLRVSCLGADAGWDCSCASETTTVNLDLEAGDAWEACSAAAEACPAAVGAF